MRDMLRVMRESIAVVDCPIVLFSTGKDSIVTLDIINQYFKNYKIIYMFFVKNLSFVDKILDYYSKKYNKEIIQIPHFTTLNTIGKGIFDFKKNNESFLKLSDMEKHIRKITECEWLVSGEKKMDSLPRRIMIKHEGDGVDLKHKKIYPIADWTENDVMKYIKIKKLPLPINYQFGFRNIDSLQKNSLLWIKNNFYEDYLKIKEVFPLIDTLLLEEDSENRKY